MLEGLEGDFVDQAVFDGFGGEAHFLIAQQAELAKDFAFADAVVELAGAPEDFHRTAADVVQPVVLLAQLQNLGAGPVIGYFDTSDDAVKQLFGHFVKGGVLGDVIADVEQLGLHGLSRVDRSCSEAGDCFAAFSGVWPNYSSCLSGWCTLATECGGLEKGLWRSEEHTSELQSRPHLVCRLLLEKKK